MVTAAVFIFLRAKRGSDKPGRQLQESLWLAVQVSWSVHEKRAETKACRCSHHGLTHLTRLLLIVLLPLHSAICDFLSDIFSVRRGCISRDGVKKNVA